ncbi:MAG: hypothetical protein ACRDMZ_22355, partial [Solirubrobacteraceae bacterium]
MALAAILALALLPGAASAQSAQPDQQPQPPSMNADEIALLFLAGRYVMPVSCKLADGRTIEVDDA